MSAPREVELLLSLSRSRIVVAKTRRLMQVWQKKTTTRKETPLMLLLLLLSLLVLLLVLMLMLMLMLAGLR